MDEPAVAIAQIAGTLSVLSIVVLEICKALPTEGRDRVRQQLEKLQTTAAVARAVSQLPSPNSAISS